MFRGKKLLFYQNLKILILSNIQNITGFGSGKMMRIRMEQTWFDGLFYAPSIFTVHIVCSFLRIELLHMFCTVECKCLYFSELFVFADAFYVCWEKVVFTSVQCT